MKNIFTFLKGLAILMVFGFSLNSAMAQSNALNFDGTYDVVGFTNPLSGTGNFTVEAWVKAPSTSIRRAIVSLGQDVLNKGLYLFINPSGKLEADLASSVGPISASTIADNTWHHVALTNTGGMFQLYIDGVANGASKYMTPNITTASGYSGWMGSTRPASGLFSFFWSGSLDEVRIWNVARTQPQIQDNMNIPVDPATSGLKIYYNFNQGTASGTNTGLITLYDCTPVHSYGTLYNFDLSGSASNWVVGKTLNVSVNNFIPPQRFGVLEFDGVGDNVEIGEPNEIDNTSFTLELWCKVDAGDKNYFFSAGKTSDNYGLYLGYSDGGYFNFSTGDGSPQNYYSPTIQRTGDFGNWVHWACVWTKTGEHTGTRTIYKNGELLYGPSTSVTLNLSAAHVNSSVWEMEISAYKGTGDYAFDGQITEFRLWTAALPQDTIRRYYKSEIQKEGHGYWKTGNDKLIRYYQTVNTGQVNEKLLIDASGHHNCTSIDFNYEATTNSSVDRIISPPIPFKVTAPANACNPYTISWRGSKDSPIYWLYRNGTRFVSTFDTSYQYTSAPGTSYTYTVRSSRSNTDTTYLKTSKYSFSATGNVNAILDPPGSLTPDANSCDGKVSLAWNISGTVPITYELQRSTGNLFTTYTRIDTAISGSLRTVDNVPPSDGTWYYRMRSKNACGTWGSYGTIVSAVYYALIAAPTGLTASIVNNKIVLNWTNNLINRAPLIIKRKKSTDPDYTVLNSSYSKDSVRFTDADFTQCTDYIYKIEVSNSCGTLTSVPSNTINLTPDLTQVIRSFTVSKGEKKNSVELSWVANNNGNENLYDYFYIYRSDETDLDIPGTTIAQVSSTSNSWSDNVSGGTGFNNHTVYRYWIRAKASCGGTTIYSNSKNDLGFSRPTVTINGKIILYGGNQAMADVVIRTTGGEFTQKKYGLDFNGTTSYVNLGDSVELKPSQAVTAEAWVYKADWGTGMSGNQFIISNYQTGGYGLYVANGSVGMMVKRNGAEINATASTTGLTAGWHHIAATFNGQLTKIYIDGIPSGTPNNAGGIYPIQYNSSNNTFIGAGPDASGYFSGRLTDIRIWNIARPDSIILRDYRRILSGKESGLAAYYRMDDNSTKMIFDCSQNGVIFNKNHGNIYNATILDAGMPTISQLNFSGVSAADGNYTIAELPYYGSSESFTLTPVYQTHKFRPVNLVTSLGDIRYLVDGMDFQDSSVYSLNGFVYYSTPWSGASDGCGAAGVNFKVNGNYQIKEGALIESGPHGEFSLQIPLGVNTVMAFKNGHKFENVLVQNFNDDIPNYVFLDTTTVKVIGFVVGGNVEGSKNPGFKKTKNNIGQALINLKTSDGCLTRTIRTDTATGEYSVKLPPMNYLLMDVEGNSGVSVPSNPVISFPTEVAQGLNLASNPSEMKLYDSVLVNGNYQNDSVSYNFIKNFVYNVPLQIRVTKPNGLKFAGDSIYEYSDSLGLTHSYELKNLPYLSFTQFHNYNMNIFAYEPYVNKDNIHNLKKDTVPVSQATITINNKIADKTSLDTVLTGSTGEIIYSFDAGSPNIATPYLKTLELWVQKAGSQTKIKWQPTNANGLSAYVYGSVPQAGLNFITTGPETPFIILRDPPGSGSSAYLEQGSKITNTESITNTLEMSRSKQLKLSLGVELSAGLIVQLETEAKLDASLKATVKSKISNETTFSQEFTTTEKWQTSDSPKLPGAKSDIFIGGSKNYLFGVTDAVYPMLPQYCYGNCTNIPGDTAALKVGKADGIFMIEGGYQTTFMYTQNHIETVVIPNLIMLRNSFIRKQLYLRSIGDTTAYIFHIDDENDPNYGLNNDDPIWGNDASTHTPAKTELADTTGQSYTFYFKKYNPRAIAINLLNLDELRWYNQQIRLWKQTLAENEKYKLLAELDRNYSIGGQVSFEKSMAVNKTWETKTSLEFNMGLEVTSTLSGKFAGAGFELEQAFGLDYTINGSYARNESETTTYGFTLNDPDIGDNLSIDVKKDKTGNGPVFSLVGGSSMCPWEGPDTVKYYTDSIGVSLSGGTQKREKLQALVSPSARYDVPYTHPAMFTLSLSNLSETNEAMVYYLSVMQSSNQHGATIKINGVTVEDRIAFTIPGGGTVNASLAIECAPDYYEYDNLQLLFYSACEYSSFNNGGMGSCFATVDVSVHFVPPCKTLVIDKPLDQFLVNSASPASINVILGGNVSDYIYQNNVILQYKPTNTSLWNNVHTWWRNSSLKESLGASSDSILDPWASNIVYPWDVTLMQDGLFNLRVLGNCEANIDPESSPVISGAFDRICPQPFGIPQPSDGILGAGDELSIQFNETVDATSLFNSFNISGVLNGSAIRHSTSLGFNGINDYMKMSGVNLASKSFSVEFWMMRTDTLVGSKQIIFSQGNDPDNSILIGINEQNKLFLHLKDTLINSNTDVPHDEMWYHWVVTYDYTNKLVEFYKDADLLASIPANITYLGYGDVYVAKPTIIPGYSYFKGNLHELRVWGKPLGLTDFYPNIASNLSGRERNLIGCWPMNEGKGTIITDIAHSRNATLTNGTWLITPAGKAFMFDNSSYAVINTEKTVFNSEQDFSVEFWFKSGLVPNACLFSNGSGSSGADIYNRNTWSVRSNASGMLQVVNNGITTNIAAGYFDNNWHHFAMSVNRMGNLSVYLDGIFKAGESGFQFSGFISPYTYLGTQATKASGTVAFSDFYTGSMDEVRIWSLGRTQEQITRDMNCRLIGNETGLEQYYPFEKYTTEYGRDVLTQTLINIAGSDTLSTIGTGASFDSDGPSIKLERPVQAVNFTYLLNNDKVILSPTSSNAKIENCILDITAKGVRDLHNNTMKSPRTWTAYVDRSPISWGSQDVILTKNIYDPLSFTVTLTNKGGNMESYSINNLPEWLTCTPQSGTIWPTASVTVTFTVNSGLNVGNYIVDIPATSSFGYDETFVLQLDVIAPAPNWSVNSADYAFTMNIVGELAVDSILSTDKSDIVAVFHGNECRGVGRMQYIGAVDKWEVFLDIYSNDASSYEQLKFKVWDASEGVIRSEVTPPLNFEADVVLGTIMQPIYINATQAQDLYIPLKTGWNWFSLNLTSPYITDVNYVLQDVQATTGDLVKAQIANYAQYTSGYGWNGNLISSGHFKNDQMYLMKMSQPDTIRFVGKVVNPAVTPITVRSGWNWIGFIPQTNFTINEALASYLGTQNGDVIKGQSSFAMYQTGMGWIGSLGFMKPGEGYMYKSLGSSTNTFNYPNTGTGLKRGEELPPVIPLSWNNNLAQYENNLSLVASVNMGEMGPVNDNMVLGAFVNNICRGYIKPTWLTATNNYLFFLPVSSSVFIGENVSFHLFDPSVNFEYSITENLAFEANTVQGDIEHPVLLTLADPNGITVNNVLTDYYLQLNPNPFRNEAIISFGLKENAQVTITVYNILGEKIDILADKQMQKGVWSQTWNGTNENGVKLSPGVYYIGMKANKFSSQIKVIITN